MTWHDALATDRATHLIVAACRRAASGVLLPALYCAEIQDAMVTAGLNVRVYDIDADLAAKDLPIDRDFRTVVWHHPFGRWLRPPRLDDVTLVEDACFGLRTALGMVDPPPGDLTVFSPRKELRWPTGGLAIGDGTPGLRPTVGADVAVTARWRRLDADAEIARAAAADRFARSEVPDLVPRRTVDSEVLSLLPLLSDTRDATIEALRASGVGAWCWQRPMQGCSQEATPGAWWLWQRLVLVPVPEPRSRIYRLLAEHRFRSWPDRLCAPI